MRSINQRIQDFINCPGSLGPQARLAVFMTIMILPLVVVAFICWVIFASVTYDEECSAFAAKTTEQLKREATVEFWREYFGPKEYERIMSNVDS